MFLLIAYSGNLILRIFLAVIGLLVAYSRIYLKRHYYIDVIGGIILGVLISMAAYYLI
jgi:membrane-associated phospholipid phosphatase